MAQFFNAFVLVSLFALWATTTPTQGANGTSNGNATIPVPGLGVNLPDPHGVGANATSSIDSSDIGNDKDAVKLGEAIAAITRLGSCDAKGNVTCADKTPTATTLDLQDYCSKAKGYVQCFRDNCKTTDDQKNTLETVDAKCNACRFFQGSLLILLMTVVSQILMW